MSTPRPTLSSWWRGGEPERPALCCCADLCIRRASSLASASLSLPIRQMGSPSTSGEVDDPGRGGSYSHDSGQHPLLDDGLPAGRQGGSESWMPSPGPPSASGPRTGRGAGAAQALPSGRRGGSQGGGAPARPWTLSCEGLSCPVAVPATGRPRDSSGSLASGRRAEWEERAATAHAAHGARRWGHAPGSQGLC